MPMECHKSAFKCLLLVAVNFINRSLFYFRKGFARNDVRLMAKGTIDVVNRLFRPSFKCSKAEALLLDLRLPGEFTDDLFAESQPAAAEKVMSVLYEINTHWGSGTLRAGSVPFDRTWPCAGI